MTPGNGDTVKNRIKRRHKKTNTGCHSCRRRRLKCDETKPQCMRCLALSQTCEGYDIPKAKSPPEQAIDSSPSPIAPRCSDDPWERWAVNFFIEYTAPKLTGFTSFTKTFWTSVVPQLSQSSQPAVRHIAIAVAAAYEERNEPSQMMPNCRAIATKHNSMAIQELTRPSSPLSTDIVLVCWNHVVAGSKILAADTRRFAEEHHGTFNPVDALVGPMFFQIMLVFSMFRQPHRLVSSFDPRTMETVSMPVIPDDFADFQEAQLLFSRIIWWRYYLVLNGDQPWSHSSPSFQTIRTFLSDWQTAFRKYVKDIPGDDVKQQEMASGILDQAQPLSGAIEYSVREDVLDSLDCYPVAVEIRSGAKASIWMQIAKNRKINLNGINQRRSGDGQCEVWLWPRAKRVRGPGDCDFVMLMFGP